MNGTQRIRQEYIKRKYEGGKMPSYKDLMRVYGVARSTAFKDIQIFKNYIDKCL